LLKRLPSAPFGRYLEAYEKASRLGPTGTALALGVEPRRSQYFRYGTQPSVAFDVVDRALMNANRTVEVDGRSIFAIGDLYPELDELAA
jgi:hypothetical protein